MWLTKVSDLIDPMTNQWGEELIDQTFWHVDRRRILVIPLPNYEMDDFFLHGASQNHAYFMLKRITTLTDKVVKNPVVKFYSL